MDTFIFALLFVSLALKAFALVMFYMARRNRGKGK